MHDEKRSAREKEDKKLMAQLDEVEKQNHNSSNSCDKTGIYQKVILSESSVSLINPPHPSQKTSEKLHLFHRKQASQNSEKKRTVKRYKLV